MGGPEDINIDTKPVSLDEMRTADTEPEVVLTEAKWKNLCLDVRGPFAEFLGTLVVRSFTILQGHFADELSLDGTFP